MTQKELETVWAMRKALGSGSTQEVTELLIAKLLQTKSNDEFITEMRNKIWI